MSSDDLPSELAKLIQPFTDEQQVSGPQRVLMTVYEMVTEISAHTFEEERMIRFMARTLMGHFGVLQILILTRDEQGRFRRAFAEGVDVPEEIHTTPEDLKGLTDMSRAAVIVDKDCWLFAPLTHETGLKAITSLSHVDSYGRSTIEGAILLGEKVSGAEYTIEDRRLLFLAGRILAISLHNCRLFAKSITDELTLVFRREYLLSRIEEELRMGEDAVTSILWVDMDNLKRINDTAGHLTGDEALRRVAAILKACVRPGDVVGRYGGDEFVLLLPLCKKENAVSIAEKIRADVAKCKLPGGLDMSVSIGVASAPEDAKSREQLLDKADQAVYFAKALGRNKVSTTQPLGALQTKQLSGSQPLHRLTQGIRALGLSLTADAVQRVTVLLLAAGVENIRLSALAVSNVEDCELRFDNHLTMEACRQMEETLKAIPGVFEVRLRPGENSYVRFQAGQ